MKNLLADLFFFSTRFLIVHMLICSVVKLIALSINYLLWKFAWHLKVSRLVQLTEFFSSTQTVTEETVKYWALRRCDLGKDT